MTGVGVGIVNTDPATHQDFQVVTLQDFLSGDRCLEQGQKIAVKAVWERIYVPFWGEGIPE